MRIDDAPLREMARDLRLGAVVIELCDGRGSMVDAGLSYWFDRVGRFCPWSARVVAEL